MAATLLLPPAILALLSLAWRSRTWLRGRADPAYAGFPDLIAGLVRTPRRYLVDVHHVVSRRRTVALMHVAAAGGVVASIPLIVAVHWFDAPPVAGLALVLALAAMLVGASLDQWRRLVRRRRLSGGAYDLVPAALAAFALFHLIALGQTHGLLDAFDRGSLQRFGFAAFGLAASFGLVFGFALGPLRHASLGVLHLAFHPRPDRFARQAAVGGMRRLDLDAGRLGASAATDFGWTEILSFDVCVQCGRCEEVCPAFAAGQPLSPKPLVVRLAGLAAAASGAETVAPDTLWSCTTCGACVNACPMLIEHVDAVVAMRRWASLEVGSQPAAVARAVEQARIRGTVTGEDPLKRWTWAADLGVRVLAEGERTDILLWLGQGALDARHQRVLRALIELLRQAGVDFAILGPAESDCGDIACRAGDEYAFATLAQANIAELKKRGFTRIVSADPHVVHTIAGEYPRYGGDFACIHHSTLLAELTRTGRISPPRRLAGAYVFHDPCYLARYVGETAAPEALLDMCVADRRTPERSGRDTFCCGAGGAAALADIPGRERIADIRMRQLSDTGADTVVVGCPNCTAMLEGASTATRIADIAEILRAATREQP